jgi:hypothetical protein
MHADPTREAEARASGAEAKLVDRSIRARLEQP